SRDVQRAHIAHIVQRAGLSISPGAAWLLVQIERDRNLDRDRLASRHGIAREHIQSIQDELTSRRWIERAGPSGDGTGKAAAQWHLTAAGCDALTKLVEARREH